MNRRQLPLAPFMALAAVAAAQPAAALPPSSQAPLAPVRVEVVGDTELATQNGKYFGADMLVGVRIDLVSTLATPQGAQASAQGTLRVQRNGGGFDVQVGSSSSASAGSDASAVAATGNVATGGEGVRVDGIGQVTQIAGDGNRMANLAGIRIGSDALDAGGLNGQLGSSASAGGLTAQVSFLDGGVQLGISGAGASLAQHVNVPGSSGQVMQLGQITGNGLVAGNVLQMQVMTVAMPTLSLQQLGIQRALAGLLGLPR